MAKWFIPLGGWLVPLCDDCLVVVSIFCRVPPGSSSEDEPRMSVPELSRHVPKAPSLDDYDEGACDDRIEIQ